MNKGLGEVLVEQGVVDRLALDATVAVQATSGMSLAKLLVDRRLATQQQIVAAVAQQMGVPFADTTAGNVDPQAAMLVTKPLALELVALPVQFGPGNELVVAVADPGNVAAVERITRLTGMDVKIALALRTDLVAAIEHLADASGDPVDSPESNGSLTAVAEPPLLPYEAESNFDLNQALVELVERGGSDLHLTTGIPPAIRRNGDLERLDGYDPLSPADLQKAIYGILTQRQQQAFEEHLELDVSYVVPGKARFRVNVFQQRGSLGAVMRVIPFDIKPISELGVPTKVSEFAHLPRGFVLVTGPTGSGKSTTLAGILDIVNRERASHIMTVEDPIEFLHKHKMSVVNQRELGTDTLSFASALKHALRQDPDVILVGELRDLETIQVALTAAETGHLVFGTLHTQDAPQSIDRIIDVFPPEQQEQIRIMLAGTLQGVLCQQLLKTPDGRGRVAACEVMVATPAIRNLIREGKTHQMYSAIQVGKQYGMVTMDQSLATLVKLGSVSYETALEKCNGVADFNRLCGRS